MKNYKLHKNLLGWITFLCINLIFVGQVSATTCVKPHDWDPVICNDPPNPGGRCQTLPRAIKNMYSMCSPSACPKEVVRAYGRCKGSLGSNHWFTVASGNSDMRCTCGCYAEETVFNSITGDLTAETMIEIKNGSSEYSVMLEGPSSFGFEEYDSNYYLINDIVYGPEKKKMIRLVTENRDVLLTGAHPVIFWEQGNEVMKVAKEARKGDFLVGVDGTPIEILAIEKIRYSKNVVNFHINSPTHMVFANGFKTGDNAWQQLLAVNEGRHLDRNEIAAILIATRKAENK